MKKILLLLITFISFMYSSDFCPATVEKDGKTWYKSYTTDKGYTTCMVRTLGEENYCMNSFQYTSDRQHIYGQSYGVYNHGCDNLPQRFNNQPVTYVYYSTTPPPEPECDLGKNEYINPDGTCDKTCSEYSGNPNAYANCICGQINHNFYEGSDYSVYVGKHGNKCYEYATGLQCLNFSGEPFGDFNYVIREVACGNENNTIPDYNSTGPSLDDNETDIDDDDNETEPDDNSTILPIDNNTTDPNSTKPGGNSTNPNDNGTSSGDGGDNSGNSGNGNGNNGDNDNGTDIGDNNGTDDNVTDDCWWCSEEDIVDPEKLSGFFENKINDFLTPYEDLKSLIDGQWNPTYLNKGSYSSQSATILGRTVRIDACSYVSKLAPAIQFIVTIMGYVVALRIFFGGMK